MCCIMDNYVEKESITYYKGSLDVKSLFGGLIWSTFNAILNGSNLMPDYKGVLCMFKVFLGILETLKIKIKRISYVKKRISSRIIWVVK